MYRRLVPIIGTMAALGFAPAALADQGLTGCTLDATVKLSNGLKAVPTPPTNFTETISNGSLSNCKGSLTDAGAQVSAGTNVTINGVAYRPLDAPLAGAGHCNAYTATGKALVQWGGSKLSVFSYTTAVYGPIAAVYGTFDAGSITLRRVVPDPANPTHTQDTFQLSYGGLTVGGPSVATFTDPTLCASTGANEVTLKGGLVYGSPS